MNLKKWVLTAAGVALLASPTGLSLFAQENTENNEDNIATMGDTNFTGADLYESMKEQYGLVTLRANIIEAVLVANVADADSARQSAVDEVQAQIDELGGEEVFQQFLAYQGLGTINQYEDQLYIRNLLEEVVAERIDTSDEALQEYYENEYQPLMEAQHILVETAEEANDVIQRIDDGEEFDAVAQEVSLDSSGQNGGLLAPFTSGVMVPEFEEAVRSLDNGEMTSEPVESEFGFHIIRAINNGEKQPLEEVREEVTEQYSQSRFEDSNFTYAIIGQLIIDSGLEIHDEELQGAVDDLIALAESQNQAVEEDVVEEDTADDVTEEENTENNDEANTEEAEEETSEEDAE